MPITLVRARSEVDAKDRAAFEGLMRKTHRQAYGFAFRLTGNGAEAEDLVQETYLRAFRFFYRYDAGMPFTNWIYRIMSNAHVDALRRRSRLRTSSLEQAGADGSTAWELPDLLASPDRPMLESLLDEPLQKAMNGMTAEFRTAVVLADLEGLAYDEIAETMGT
ncbi:MAG: sigma-70 family RNA polymerase sigma factor, partial [Fimbriimonas ginsengisoli]|nr:sigma-70 family RNA polymerase sigma factor [Fimbriimonas ginsengisoli]